MQLVTPSDVYTTSTTSCMIHNNCYFCNRHVSNRMCVFLIAKLIRQSVIHGYKMNFSNLYQNVNKSQRQLINRSLQINKLAVHHTQRNTSFWEKSLQPITWLWYWQTKHPRQKHKNPRQTQKPKQLNLTKPNLTNLRLI